MKKIFWYVLVTFTLLLLLMPVNLLQVEATFIYQDTYLFKDETPTTRDVNDGMGFFKWECTSYVAWKMNERAGTTTNPYYFTNGMTGPNGAAGKWGGAGNWITNASTIGFTADTNPNVGDIAAWTSGHVAFVEQVTQNGDVYISEYNWNYGDQSYNERWLNSTQKSTAKYIHIFQSQPVDRVTMTAYNGNLYLAKIKSDSTINIAVYDGLATSTNFGPVGSYGGRGKGIVSQYVHNGKLFQSVRGMNDRVYDRTFNGVVWSDWSSSSIIQTGGNISMEEYQGTLYRSIRDLSGEILYASYNDSTNSWNNWIDTGGQTDADIEVKVYNDRLYFAVKSTDHQIYKNVLNSSAGSLEGWTVVSGTTDAKIGLEVFGGKLFWVVSGDGSEKVWMKSYDTSGCQPLQSCSGTWSNWYDNGGITPGLTAMVPFNSRLLQVVRGGNLNVYDRTCTAVNACVTWVAYGGQSTVDLDMEVMGTKAYEVARSVTTLPSDRVFVRSTSDGSTWGSWKEIY